MHIFHKECLVCGKVQEYWSSVAGDSGWTDLSAERYQVFREQFRPEHCLVVNPKVPGFEIGEVGGA